MPPLAVARRSRRRSRLAIATLGILAIVMLVASAFAKPIAGQLAQEATFGPISLLSNQYRAYPSQSWSAATNFSLKFSVRLNASKTTESIVSTAPGIGGIHVTATPTSAGTRDIRLTTVTTTGRQLNLPIAFHVRPRQTTSIAVSAHGSTEIQASANGKQVFDISVPLSTLEPGFNQVVIGRNPKAHGTFSGRISGLVLHFEQYSGSQPRALAGILRGAGLVALGAGLLSGIALLLSSNDEALLAFWKRLRRLLSTAPSSRSRRGVTVIAATGLVCGVVLLAVSIPTDDVSIHSTGTANFAVPNQRAGSTYSLNLAGARSAFSQTASIDTLLTFQLRPTRAYPARSSQIFRTLVSTGPLSVVANRSGQLLGIASVTDEPADTPLLTQRAPAGVWSSVSLAVSRNRSAVFRFNGEEQWSYSYSEPILAMAPSRLLVSAGTGHGLPVDIRNVRLHITTYSSDTSLIAVLAHRLLALLAALIIALSVMLLFRINETYDDTTADSSINRRLVMTVVGCLWAGIVINLAIDHLRLQTASTPWLPRDTWLPFPQAMYTDYFQVIQLLRGMDPYGLQSGSYPPLGFWLTGPIAWLPEYVGLWSLLAAFLGFLVWWSQRSFARGVSLPLQCVIVLSIVMSYPVTFAMARGNIDLIVFAFLCLAVANISHRRARLSTVLFTLAASIKIYPALYLLTVIRRTSARYFGAVVGVIVIGSLVALVPFHGSLSMNVHGLRHGLGVVEQQFDGTNSTYFNTTLLGFLQSVGFVVDGVAGATAVRSALHAFVVPEELLGFCWLAWFLIRREHSLWRALTLITVAMLLLPDVSYDYTAIYMLIPIAIFVRDQRLTGRHRLLAVLFGLFLAPKVYYYFGDSPVNTQVLFSAPLLIAIAAVVIADYRSEVSKTSSDGTSGAIEVTASRTLQDASAASV